MRAPSELMLKRRPSRRSVVKGVGLLAVFVIVAHLAPMLLLVPIIFAPLFVALRLAGRSTVWEYEEEEEGSHDPPLTWRVARTALALTLVLVGCAVVPVMNLVSQVLGSWLLYPAVTRTIAGPLARDCGSEFVFSLQEPSEVTSCIADALSNGQRFRARVELPGIDSYLWTAVARGPAGLFVIEFDSSPGGFGDPSPPSVRSRRCGEPVLDEDLQCLAPATAPFVP